MLNFWNGNKTRILMALGALLTAVYGMDLISFKLMTTLSLLIGYAGGVTVHEAIMRESSVVAAKVATVEEKVETVDRKVATVAPTIAYVAAQVEDIKSVVEEVASPVDVPRVIVRP